ncbi:MAG: DUF1987 domain-containing protein [Flavobacteriales bacterium]
MSPLIIEITEDTPEVNFNSTNGEFLIRGRSLPEDAYSFYQPINDWLEEFQEKSDLEKVNLSIQLDYFNSSSGRYLLEMFAKVQSSTKVQFEITWMAEKDDELMIEKGEELKSLVSIPFHLKEI